MTAISIPIPSPQPPAGELTIGELVTLYCELELPNLDPSPQRQRRALLDRFCETFGSWAWTQLRKSDVRRWVQRQETWKADDTRRNALIGLKRVFNWACEDDRIPRNPIDKLSWPEGEPRRPMTAQEFALLLRGSDPIFRRVLVFLRWVGCRPGELARLEWSMLDWSGSAQLDKHKTRKKTRKPRILYLPKPAVLLLGWLARNRIPGANERYCFVNARGESWVGKNDASSKLSQRLSGLRKRVGVAEDLTLYGLRHRFGTDSQVNGNNLSVTAELMGHASTRTTHRYYTHLEQHRQFLLQAAERVGKKG